MNRESCDGCYFGTLCASKTVCNDYYPIDEQHIDNDIDNEIERGREEFYQEWFLYITEK